MSLASAWNNFKSNYNTARQTTAARIAADKVTSSATPYNNQPTTSGGSYTTGTTRGSGATTTTTGNNKTATTTGNNKTTTTTTTQKTSYVPGTTRGSGTTTEQNNALATELVNNTPRTNNNVASGPYTGGTDTSLAGDYKATAPTVPAYKAPNSNVLNKELVAGASRAGNAEGVVKNINSYLGLDDDEANSWMGDADDHNYYKNLIISRYGQDVWDAYSQLAAKQYADYYGETPGQTRASILKGGNNLDTTIADLQAAIQSNKTAAANYASEVEAAKNKSLGEYLTQATKLAPAMYRLAKQDYDNSSASGLNAGIRNTAAAQAGAKAITDLTDEYLLKNAEAYDERTIAAMKAKLDAEDKAVDANATIANAVANKEAYTGYGVDAAKITSDAQIKAAQISYDAAIASASNANATANQKEGLAQINALMNSKTQPSFQELYAACRLLGMEDANATAQANNLIKQWNNKGLAQGGSTETTDTTNSAANFSSE